MKNYFTLSILIILSIAGIYFLGRALTGLVVSESCCFGENCKAENLCDSAKPKHIEQPINMSNNQGVYLGLLLMLISVVIYFSFIYKIPLTKNKKF